MNIDSKIITELVRQGKKLEAVRLLRRTMGIDLKAATEEVERIIAANPGLTAYTGTPLNPTPDEPVSDEVRALAQQGKKMEAIKLLRRQTGLKLKEAKEKVDGISGVKHEGYGCFGVLLLLVVGAAAVVVVAA